MSDRRGFTLLETLIVVTLMFVLALTGYVASLTIVRWQSLLNNTNLVTSQIALAQMESYSGSGDQAHGVKVLSTDVVRFVGNSYATRNPSQDVVLPLATNTTIIGDTEVVFPSGGLAPSQSMSLTLEMGIRTYDLTVSSYGVLDITKGVSEP